MNGESPSVAYPPGVVLSPLSGDAHHSLGDRSGHPRPHSCMVVAVKYTQGVDHCLVLWDGRQKRGYKPMHSLTLSFRDVSHSHLSPLHPAHLVPSTSPFQTGSARQEFHPVLAPPRFRVFWKLSLSARSLEAAGLWLNQGNTACRDN